MDRGFLHRVYGMGRISIVSDLPPSIACYKRTTSLIDSRGSRLQMYTWGDFNVGYRVRPSSGGSMKRLTEVGTSFALFCMLRLVPRIPVVFLLVASSQEKRPFAGPVEIARVDLGWRDGENGSLVMRDCRKWFGALSSFKDDAASEEFPNKLNADERQVLRKRRIG